MTSLINIGKNGKQTISRHIYGQFAEHLGKGIYEGIWVGEESSIPNTRGIRNDVVNALKNINVPNIRWPGGCFADEYHWKDGIGPRKDRPEIINTNWGGVTENNHFGTHEFMDLCEQVGAEPCICGNLGSGTVREMAEWVEYITSDGDSPMTRLRKENGREKPWKLKYFGIGNENWGCGGKMRVEYYADEYRRYQHFVKNYSDNEIYKIAVGPSEADYHWTEVMMEQGMEKTQEPEDKLIESTWDFYQPEMSGLSLHYYTRNRAHYPLATEIDEDAWFDYMRRSLVMEELIVNHSALMDKYDPDKKVGLIIDEWGTWFKTEPGTNPGFLYQQNTLRDALIAGIHLNIFNNHSDRVHMANIAQMVNVLQAMILTEREKMILTPTYHVFDMYKVHQDSTLLPVDLKGEYCTFKDSNLPKLNVSASGSEDGKIHITICNIDPKSSEEIICKLDGLNHSASVSAQVLTADLMNEHNTFENPENIKPENFSDITIKKDELSLTIPSKSVLAISIN